MGRKRGIEVQSFDDFANADKLREELVEWLIRLEIECRNYQTDIYLYAERGEHGEIIGSLDDFINVGGNSWLNDDHYTLHCAKENCRSAYDDAQSVDEFAYFLDIPEAELREHTVSYLKSINEADDDIKPEDVDWNEVCDYISHDEELDEKFQKAREAWIRSDFTDEFKEQADEIIREFDDDLKMRREQEAERG